MEALRSQSCRCKVCLSVHFLDLKSTMLDVCTYLPHTLTHITFHVICNLFPGWRPLMFSFKMHIMVNTSVNQYGIHALLQVYAVALKKMRLNARLKSCVMSNMLYTRLDQISCSRGESVWSIQMMRLGSTFGQMARPQWSSFWSHLSDLLWKHQPVKRKQDRSTSVISHSLVSIKHL